MDLGGCNNRECTVAQTGTCVLGNVPSECEHLNVEAPISTELLDSSLTDPVLESPIEKPKLSPSVALGFQDVATHLAKEQGHIIGILGSPESGKTACLVSLYLSLSNGSLNGLTYADSKSLLIFDELSRGARDWTGSVPNQMTVHTELKDDRTAGFLHLKLCRDSDGKLFNIFIPDLPGEWSTSLIDNNEHERLGFLKAATSIWMVVDGSTLLDVNKCRFTIHRTKMLINRLAAMFKPAVPALRLVITRRDQGTPNPNYIDQIKQEALKLNICLMVDYIASFSENPVVPPSTGISELIQNSLSSNSSESVFWPDNGSKLHPTRQMLKFVNEDTHE